MSIKNDPEYARLMQTVGVLDSHYGTLMKKARQALLDAKWDGDTATADKYKSILRKMSGEHEEALDLIASKLVRAEQLRATRKALRGSADKAHKFIKTLRNVKLTIEKLTEAAGFLSGLITDLRRIF